ncbi:MAG: hypothetical protein O7F71_07785 [Gammaproteobacteria bacterium]|nr:hypothetical protein [Gammaproteobacteria bacterium]
MLLQNGQWLGRGSLLVEGASRGEKVECDVAVESDDGGFTITGEAVFKEMGKRELTIRVADNDVGTYTLRVQIGNDVLNGTAKLDSPPNLGLVWNDAGSVHATFALFSVSNGYGFRGFSKLEETTYTWEVAFSLRQDVIGGDNVVSLARRRRR